MAPRGAPEGLKRALGASRGPPGRARVATPGKVSKLSARSVPPRLLMCCVGLVCWCVDVDVVDCCKYRSMNVDLLVQISVF